MWSKLVSFFMSIVMFFMGLFGLSDGKTDKSENGFDIVFTQNVRYADGERNFYDIAYPKNASGNVDLVLAIHGGAWVSGSKENETNVIKATAQKGYVAAAINYSYVSTSVHCDTLMNEITAALKAIKSYMADKGINVSKVILRGESAGAHMAVLYAYTKADEAKLTAGITPVAVFDYSAPTALNNVDIIGNMLLTDFGIEGIEVILSNLCGVTVNTQNCSDPDVKKALEAVSPVCFASTALPTVICHGVFDTIAPYLNATSLDAALTTANVTHTLITFPTSSHFLENDKEQMEKANDLFNTYLTTYLSAYTE